MEESKFESEIGTVWLTLQDRIIYVSSWETGGRFYLGVFAENIPGEDEEAEVVEVGTAHTKQVVRDWCEAKGMEWLGALSHRVTPWGCTIEVRPVAAEDES